VSELSVAEAAARYDLGQTTVWTWLRQGRLKRYRRGGDRRTFVDEEQLRRLVALREVGGPRKAPPPAGIRPWSPDDPSLGEGSKPPDA
jgi:hypothetical protein